jgi:Uma2 family endonuclease
MISGTFSILFEGDEALDPIDQVVQPDAFVMCDKGTLIEEGVLGAPDFVIEVLSTGTAMMNQAQKRRLYEARGVREYWIVNPETLEVFMYTYKTQLTSGPSKDGFT